MEYFGKLLQPSHGIIQHVHRVVSRIFEANNFGTLSDDQSVTAPHRACCNQALDSLMVKPRTLFRICEIRILLGVVRRMALDKRVELVCGE